MSVYYLCYCLQSLLLLLVLQQSKNVTEKCTETLSPLLLFNISLVLAQKWPRNTWDLGVPEPLRNTLLTLLSPVLCLENWLTEYSSCFPAFSTTWCFYLLVFATTLSFHLQLVLLNQNNRWLEVRIVRGKLFIYPLKLYFWMK